jgi:multimeric flavodoxin WrbA
MARKSYSDSELMRIIGINAKTLAMFKKVRENAIDEAKKLAAPRKGRIRVLGVSGSARDAYDMAREESNSEELLKRCLKHCEKMGAETELLALRKHSIGHCKACYSTTNTQCHFYCSCYPKATPAGDDMTNIIYDKLLKADAIIFATPVNNFKISTLMAAFIDRCISMDGSLGPADPKDPKNAELNKKHMKFIELTADPGVPGSGMLRRFPGKIAGVIVCGHEAGAGMTISNLFMTLNHYGMLFPPFSNMYAMNSVCNSTYSDKKNILGNWYDEEVKVVANNVMAAVKATRKAGVGLAAWSYDNSKN